MESHQRQLTSTQRVIILHSVVDLYNYIPRVQERYLGQLLKEFPVVILTGARQTGKTTLATSFTIGADRAYRSFDDFATQDVARRDPAALFSDEQRITLDEVQRIPEILSAIKIEVDRKRTPGRFLCTGSANLLLMKQVAESLAGRAVYLEVPPFAWAELARASFGAALDALARAPSVAAFLRNAPRPSAKSAARHRLTLVKEAVFHGGFPVAALLAEDSARSRWFEGYVSTYLERDVRLLSPIGDLVAFRRFMQAAATRNGALLNVAQLAQDAGVPPSTANRYLSLLEISFLVWRAPAFGVNRGKRLVKTPRLLWVDSGLAAHLAGFRSAQELAESRLWGAWLEAWIGLHLRTWASLNEDRPRLSYWRTSTGQEVDFIVESTRSLLPIEVKATSRPVGEDIKGLETFLDLHKEAKLGVIACACSEILAVSSRVVAVPFETLLLA
jgi:uncharacterized protein